MELMVTLAVRLAADVAEVGTKAGDWIYRFSDGGVRHLRLPEERDLLMAVESHGPTPASWLDRDVAELAAILRYHQERFPLRVSTRTAPVRRRRRRQSVQARARAVGESTHD